MAAASSSSSLPPWIILHKFVGVSLSSHLQAEDFYLFPEPPPGFSHFKIPVGEQIPDDPRVLSSDLSAGLFLLRTNGYAVLSTVSRTLTPVRPRRADDPAILGVIGCNEGRSMVVGLEYKRSSPKAWLHYYFPGASATWTTKEVDNPLLPLGLTGNFVSKDVIAHDGRLWWVSDANNAASSSGLLSCDPSADNPQLVFSTSPDLVGYCRDGPCRKIPRVDRRCVQVGDGKLRWVQILCEHSLPRQSGKAPAVCVLTLDDHTAQWRRGEDHLMSLADVWNDDSYKSTSLPRKEPAIALIDPGKLFGFDTVYFSLDRYLFGVDMVNKTVVDGPHRHSMLLDSEDSSSSHLLPWAMPPELRSCLLEAVAPLVV